MRERKRERKKRERKRERERERELLEKNLSNYIVYRIIMKEVRKKRLDIPIVSMSEKYTISSLYHCSSKYILYTYNEIYNIYHKVLYKSILLL